MKVPALTVAVLLLRPLLAAPVAPQDGQTAPDAIAVPRGPAPAGPYFGQAPPGDAPAVFARGIVSTDHLEHSAPAFSPDGNEVFWSLWRRPDHGEPQVIMTMRREGGTWSAPAVAPFSGTSVDGGPVFSADGRRLYFSSADPAPPPPGGMRIYDIFFVEKRANGWSERKSLGLLARFPDLRSAAGPSIARNGTLYFSANFGIYRAELIDGEYAKPQLLPQSINEPGTLNWTPFIASDESYLLFSSGRGNRHGGDLYVARRAPDGTWSQPETLPDSINTPEQERFPLISPDGQYLFFTRSTPDHSHDVYWVDTRSIPALRAEPASPNPIAQLPFDENVHHEPPNL